MHKYIHKWRAKEERPHAVKVEDGYVKVWARKERTLPLPSPDSRTPLLHTSKCLLFLCTPPKNGTHFLSCLLKYLPCTESLWRSCAVWEEQLPRALCPSCCSQSVLYFYTPSDMCSCSLLITHTKTKHSSQRQEQRRRTEREQQRI